MRPASRLTLVLASGVLLVAAGYLVLLAWLPGREARAGLGGFHATLQVDATLPARVAVTALAAALACVLSAAMAYEFAPRRDPRFALRAAAGGTLRLPRSTVEGRLEDDARAVPHVIDAAARAGARRGRVTAAVTVRVDRDASIPQVLAAIERALEGGLRERLGVELSGPADVVVLYDELALRPPSPSDELAELPLTRGLPEPRGPARRRGRLTISRPGGS